MTKEDLIRQLSSADLFAECPHCHQEFKLGEALLFDGLKTFPKQAKEIQSRLKEDLVSQKEELKIRKVRVDVGTEQVAKAVGFGTILEKIAPAHKDFGIPLYDCRPLFEPVDIIAFNGLGSGKIESITFCEIKTGKARLNPRERMVKEAVEDGRVDYRVME